MADRVTEARSSKVEASLGLMEGEVTALLYSIKSFFVNQAVIEASGTNRCTDQQNISRGKMSGEAYSTDDITISVSVGDSIAVTPSPTLPLASLVSHCCWPVSRGFKRFSMAYMQRKWASYKAHAPDTPAATSPVLQPSRPSSRLTPAEGHEAQHRSWYSCLAAVLKL
ncbi:hypothetical protein Pmani_018058 [Petrolisthes manimaculis]|uniref:Uncharacterized protein n=1 Tax=Petrolisthes manimaculis TaxID=1843537 RepID=A0AAE1PL00_9EUCA|nr:hypothetical protein Pmani_018058 [Petrolisthes manimaculis]